MLVALKPAWQDARRTMAVLAWWERHAAVLSGLHSMYVRFCGQNALLLSLTVST